MRRARPNGCRTIGRQQFGQPFFAPSGLSPAVVAAYRDAFVQRVNDPAFLRDAAQVQATVDLARGEAVADFVGRLHATPGPVLERAIALTKAATE